MPDHRPARDEDHRQMAETQRAHHQARDDLVADAQHQRAVEHVVGQRHRRGHGDHFAAGRLSSMPGSPWVTPSHMAGVPPANWPTEPTSRRAFDLLREVLVRLVRREHVVI
jgi:hypothetical protein